MTKIDKAEPYKDAIADHRRALKALVRSAVLKERREIAALVRSAHERCNRDNAEFRSLLMAIDVRP